MRLAHSDGADSLTSSCSLRSISVTANYLTVASALCKALWTERTSLLASLIQHFAVAIHSRCSSYLSANSYRSYKTPVDVSRTCWLPSLRHANFGLCAHRHVTGLPHVATFLGNCLTCLRMQDVD